MKRDTFGEVLKQVPLLKTSEHLVENTIFEENYTKNHTKCL